MTNTIQWFVGLAKRDGLSNAEINVAVADHVKRRGPVGTGKYACTCNNWGPRWGENSLSGCCEGCFRWAIHHHQEMNVNGVEPPTHKMIKENTWGIIPEKIAWLNVQRDIEREFKDLEDKIVEVQNERDHKDYMRSLKD